MAVPTWIIGAVEVVIKVVANWLGKNEAEKYKTDAAAANAALESSEHSHEVEDDIKEHQDDVKVNHTSVNDGNGGISFNNFNDRL